VQARYQELVADRGELARILGIGAARAQEYAAGTLLRAQRALGLR
jgi:hypothetical protein